VASAIELTAGVTELFRAANFLNEHLNLLGAAMRDGFADIGALLEALIQDITHEVRDGDDSWLSPAVREFLDSRAKAREEADEAAAAEAEALKAQLEAEEAQLDLGG
jgi:hypothetical protein